MSPEKESEKYGNSEVGNSVTQNYLVFKTNNCLWCAPLCHIKEIITSFNIRKVPNLPSHMRGIIDVRGAIISVVDMNKKNGNGFTNFEERQTCIIIFEYDNIIVGVLVDEVLSVSQFTIEQIDNIFSCEERFQNGAFNGLIKSKDGLILLMDLHQAIDEDHLNNFEIMGSA